MISWNPIREVGSSRNLLIYGAFLSLAHVLTWTYWHNKLRLTAILSDPLQTPLCWGYFEACHVLRPLSESIASSLLTAYLLLGIVSAGAFIVAVWRNTVFTRIALTLFALLSVTKLGITALDYRLMGNYHYMHNILCLSFLLIPGRKILLQVLVVSFYLSAGILKFNPEWLSGAAMINPPAVSGKSLEWLNYLVIVLEMLIAPLLLARHRLLFWPTLGLLAVFHGFSWHIVGYFYPLTMACLLQIFILERLWPEKPLKRLSFALIKDGKYRPVLVALGFFWLAQLMPHLFPGDSAVTGEGRIFALNMFDSHTECHILMKANFADHSVELHDPHYLREFGVRIWCDPLVYINQARHYCRHAKEIPGFQGVQLLMNSRRLTDAKFTPLTRIKNVCASDLNYEYWRPNDWIEDAG